MYSVVLQTQNIVLYYRQFTAIYSSDLFGNNGFNSESHFFLLLYSKISIERCFDSFKLKSQETRTIRIIIQGKGVDKNEGVYNYSENI